MSADNQMQSSPVSYCISGASPGRPDAKAVKENQIPNEILQTIDTFK
jgi:hypothetical protein